MQLRPRKGFQKYYLRNISRIRLGKERQEREEHDAAVKNRRGERSETQEATFLSKMRMAPVTALLLHKAAINLPVLSL